MTLRDKAIDIHGKKYVLVKDRILAFNELYPEHGSIITKLLSKPEDKLVVIRATVTIMDRTFTGHSQAEMGGSGVNATAALENAETSAVGRALAMMGIGVIDSVASVDEVNKASYPTSIVEARENVSSEVKTVTEKQVKFINTLISNLKKDREAIKSFYKVKSMNDLTRIQASDLIENLNKQATTVH